MFKHILPIFGYPAVIAQNTTLLANFFRRDLLGRFRGSFLGLFWVLLQPMFLFAIYYFVFGYLFAARGTDRPKVEFALYLFAGIIAYNSFSESTIRACNVIIENGNLIKKVAFPCELLPIPAILVSVIVYLVGAIVFLTVGFAQGQIEVSSAMLALPVVLVVHVAMCLGFGLLLGCLQVLVRDTSHLYTILTQAWFFLSPVFWPHRMLERKLEEFIPGSSWVLELNPLYALIQAHRLALGFSSSHPEMCYISGTALPSVWYHVGCAALWASFFLVLGYSFFTSRKSKFADLV